MDVRTWLYLAASMAIGTGTAYAAAQPQHPVHPAAAKPAAHVAKAKNPNAPADVYFGKLGYSALSIRYHLQRLRAQLHMSASNAPNVMHDAQFAEDAFYLWATRYPKDSWLPQTGYALAELYAATPDPQARDHAERAYRFIDTHFPKTKYAHLSRLALQAGIPTPAAAVAAQTPAATESATPVADAASTNTAAPSAPVVAPAVAVPSPDAAPSPDASPAPNAAPSSPAKRKIFGF